MQSSRWFSSARWLMFALHAACDDAPVDEASPDAGSCMPIGTWRIDYTGDETCGPRDETLAFAVDDDAGTPAITFLDRGQRASNCGSFDASSYEARAEASADGCTLTTSVRSAWCYASEQQCEDLDLVLSIRGGGAQLTGSYRRCWCGTTGPSGRTVELSGTALRQ